MNQDLSNLSKEELEELKEKLKNAKYLEGNEHLADLNISPLKKPSDSFLSEDLDVSKIDLPDLEETEEHHRGR